MITRNLYNFIKKNTKKPNFPSNICQRTEKQTQSFSKTNLPVQKVLFGHKKGEAHNRWSDGHTKTNKKITLKQIKKYDNQLITHDL